MAAGKLRTVGPIKKGAGNPTGINLQNEEKDGMREEHVRIASLNEDNIFGAGVLKPLDEIVMINGEKITSAKEASKTIVAADELTLTVRTHHIPSSCRHAHVLSRCRSKRQRR